MGNFEVVLYTIIISFIILALLRNLLSFFILQKKLYLYFSFFLMCLAAIIFIKRIYLALPFYNNHFEAIFSSFAFVLISGATLLFNSEFLEVKIINPFTKGFFFFELLLCTLLSLLSFWIKQYHLFAQIMYTFVFIYALIVFLMVIFQEVNTLISFFPYQTKVWCLLYNNIILIISGSYALYKHPSLPPLALLLSIVFT